VGAVGITELRFPPRYEQPRSTPERGYLAFVLDGALEKSFPRRMLVLPDGAAASIPADGLHTASFGPTGARVLVVRSPRESRKPYSALVSSVNVRRDPGLSALARRLAGKLSAPDEAAPVAAETRARASRRSRAGESGPPAPAPAGVARERRRATPRRSGTLAEPGRARGERERRRDTPRPRLPPPLRSLARHASAQANPSIRTSRKPAISEKGTGAVTPSTSWSTSEPSDRRSDEPSPLNVHAPFCDRAHSGHADQRRERIG